MRERTEALRCFAASYSAVTERSPSPAAAASSFGSSKVTSYFKSASSFLSLARTGSSMPGSGSVRGLGEDLARELARGLAVDPARKALTERGHHGAHLARDARGEYVTDGPLELVRAERCGYIVL